MSLDALHKQAVAIRNEALRQTLEDFGENTLSPELQSGLTATNRKRPRHSKTMELASAIPESVKRRSGRLAGQERTNLNVSKAIYVNVRSTVCIG